jgi:quinol monooxygenase YgiN
MELYIFGRFEVRTGAEGAFEEALREVVTATRAEAGCTEVHGYRATRKARVYYLHSRWKDEAVFEEHAKLPHTVNFLGALDDLLEKPRDVARTERIV